MNRRVFTFDADTHTYTDDRNFSYTSVTTLIHKYVPPYDRVKHAKRLARGGKGHYKGKTWKEILSLWDEVTDEAIDKGNDRHNYLENGVKTATGFKEDWVKLHRPVTQVCSIYDVMDNPNMGILDLVKFEELVGIRYPKVWEAISYYVNLGFRVYSEIVVYDEPYLVSGMIDLPLIHPDGRFVILDWKTNKHDIKFEAGYYKRDEEQQTTKQWVPKRETMLAPLDGIDNCNGNVYSMQLSTYARLLEKFGFKFEYIILAHIREHYQLNKYGMPFRDKRGQFISVPELGERVEFHPINFYRGHVDAMLNHHFNKTMGIYGIQSKIF